MRKKTPPKKRKKGTTGRKYTFKFTRKELFLWLGAAFLALVWMFTLGVIVGRGLSPVRFDIEKLKKELIALKEEALKNKEVRAGADGQPSPDAKHLGFYDILTDKKEEARLKSLPGKIRKTSRTAQSHAGPENSKQKPKVKTAVVKKDRLREKQAAAGKQERQGAFTLQVASLKDKIKADRMVSMLKKKGYGAYAVSTKVLGKGTYHRVRVGHFSERDDAVKMASRLKRDDFDSIVMEE